jgi:hypothetical protein
MGRHKGSVKKVKIVQLKERKKFKEYDADKEPKH